MNFGKLFAGTFIGAVLYLIGGTLSPALAGNRVFYPVSQETVGHSQMDPQYPETCTMTRRSPNDLNVVRMQDLDQQFSRWEVSDEAFWAVTNLVDCWRTDQVAGNPMGMADHSIHIYGSYQVPTPEGLRVFVNVEWEEDREGVYFNDFQVWQLLLAHGGEAFTIEDLDQDLATNMLRMLAQEGWSPTQLRDWAEAVMPQHQELGGLEKISDSSLRAAVEAIYAVDEYAEEGEDVTDVIYVSDSNGIQAIIKVLGPNSEWTLAINITHEHELGFIYIGENTEVSDLVDSLRITESTATEYLAAL
jgi:hypothetical protein